LIAVAAASFAAPLVKLTRADPILLAFWRVALAAAGAWILVAIRHARGRAAIGPPSGKPRASVAGALLAGALLGLHFWVWIGSLGHTSVASSVLLVTTQPVWAALGAMIFLREPVPRLGWLGIAIALAGSAISIGFAGGALRGDLMALAGAILAAAYMVVGRRERQRWDALPYLARVYGAAAVTLAVGVLVSGRSFAPARPSDWWVFAALAAIPTGLGHSLYNWSLKHFPAYVVATSITLEPIGSSILAYWWTGETPSPRAFLVAPIILAGIILVARSQRGADRASAPDFSATNRRPPGVSVSDDRIQQ
jgi:drug/metabolite transporter (DMT)-like permease